MESSPGDIETDVIDLTALTLPGIATVETTGFAAYLERVLDCSGDAADPLFGGSEQGDSPERSGGPG